MKKRRLRSTVKLWSERLHLKLWFPHVPLAILVFLGGAVLINTGVNGNWEQYLRLLLNDDPQSIKPGLMATLLIGGGMLLTAIGLLFRSRLAWSIMLLLVAVAGVSASIELGNNLLVVYFSLLLIALFVFWRRFDRSSAAASTLFGVTSIIMLIGYSTFGSYYMGTEFDPPIEDLVTAFYWSMVTMSTVGYGDISPATGDSRLFTASVIILGLTVFATALTAVIAPLVGRSIARIVKNQGEKMKRENHFIVIGNTFLATSTANSLEKRGQSVTRLFRVEHEENEAEEFDTVIGNPSSTDVLREAGVEHAEAVIAMLDDDSENAFVILAVQELAPNAETIVAVNDATHMDRIRLVHPDVLITPQSLGGELAAMLLSGEEITPEFVTDNIFERLSRKN